MTFKIIILVLFAILISNCSSKKDWNCNCTKESNITLYVGQYNSVVYTDLTEEEAQKACKSRNYSEVSAIGFEKRTCKLYVK